MCLSDDASVSGSFTTAVIGITPVSSLTALPIVFEVSSKHLLHTGKLLILQHLGIL
jgi:hypothetical protein